MFHKILVVLSATEQSTDIFTVALGYAKSFNATLRIVDSSEVASVSNHRSRSWIEKLQSLQDLSVSMGLVTDVVKGAQSSVWQMARQWSADLIVLGDRESLDTSLQVAPCSVLQVKYRMQDAVTSVQIILKQKQEAPDLVLRQRLEALLLR